MASQPASNTRRRADLPDPTRTHALSAASGNVGKTQSATEHGQGRAGRRTFLVGIVAMGLFGGLRTAETRRHQEAMMLTEQVLAGTWELKTVDEESVGDPLHSVVLSQRVTFRNGIVHGETRLRGDSPAATTNMPFPDASVTQVSTRFDGREVNVVWDGSYRLLSNNRIELSLGLARYRVVATWNPQTCTLEMDHDTILTYRGTARYRPAKQSSLLESASIPLAQAS